jgi:membrane fusion protein (multidrug efflux system)
MLVPGGYVTALLRNPDGKKGILIPQKALLVDQQGTYVLTVDENSTVAPVRITAGTQIGSDISVLSGLKPGDRVIVDGVQKAQPGATVRVIEE